MDDTSTIDEDERAVIREAERRFAKALQDENGRDDREEQERKQRSAAEQERKIDERVQRMLDQHSNCNQQEEEQFEDDGPRRPSQGSQVSRGQYMYVGMLEMRGL